MNKKYKALHVLKETHKKVVIRAKEKEKTIDKLMVEWLDKDKRR